MDLSEQTIQKSDNASRAGHEDKATKLSQISKPGWGYVFKRSVNSFTGNGGTDLAASLTYFAVLSLFPGLLAVVSLLGVFGQGDTTTHAILDFIRPYAPEELMALIKEPITQLTSSTGAGIIALITGVVGALWTASGYVGGFGRALNRIYGVVEGRPIWKLRPINLLVTFVMVVIVVIMMLMILLSGSVLHLMGDWIGLGDTAVAVWSWARWIVLLVLTIIVIALLYYATPNVKQPKLHWLSPGAIVALLVMGIAGVGFGFYVSNFGNYNATYGTIGGVIVMLLFIWIMNNVLLFGAVLDSELERARELEAGMRAEDELQLPPRDTRQAHKQVETRQKFVDEGRRLRLHNDRLDYSED
ncbi:MULTISPECIES: YihY/virulence factor BrkB family protein [Micrococcales]|uniref:YihY/virulence factor BrkB family protein n=1 Tax=Micrococcales TaxID=85006 RepID=UPI00069201EA|nr:MULTISPECIES: YihY/virulence factor BrkB family protein [Micrococcales]